MTALKVLWEESELERVSCNYCGSDSHRFIVKRPDGLDVVECSRCGLAFLNPRPGRESIRKLYAKTYYVKPGGAELPGVGYSGYDSMEKDTFALDFTEKYFPVRGKRLLEIGCAYGTLMGEAARRGAAVTGVELSEYACGIARQKGLNVLNGDFLELSDKLEGSYDLIAALELIEHLSDPAASLKRMAGLLKDGGCLLISTANYRCSYRLGSSWLGFNTSFEHLYFISDELLFRMGRQLGLSLVSWYTFGSGETSGKHPQAGSGRIRSALGHFPTVYRALSNLRSFFSGKDRGVVNEIHGQGHLVTALFRKEPGQAHET